MIAFKCKMCGGEMELEEGATVAECPYCLTKQTLPKLDNDKRANMYDRANHFRRQNEYDKAMAIFENILQEDRTDAEAYWSLVLCRYGIEYVEDPATHKRVPTVNRVQYTSILADEDYKSALEYADFAQRSVYESEGKAIDEIQKGILAISKQEKPFDVFICYKETDANGRRTPDSVLANDLYHQLTNEGFKVFFSRITLEDKIGTAYEPYIFAALNSAKVMVVLGTKPEYFNAVWVKNEWSRYLALIRAGADKTLVPAYRDMDPYDLPEEFSHLQAQDMSKLGFMQDLIRGIKKLTRIEEEKEEKKPTQQFTPAPSGSTIESLMKRALLFLEDGDFTSANEYLDKVLDINPEHAPAYVGKVQISLGLRNEGQLKRSLTSFEMNSDWKKAIRFATPEQKKRYQSYADDAKIAQENDRKEKAYQTARSILNSAKDAEQYNKAITAFSALAGYKDSSEQKARAQSGLRKYNEEQERKAEEARRIRELQEKEKARKAKIRGIVIAAIAVLAIVGVAVSALLNSINNNNDYNAAVNAAAAGNNAEAVLLYRKSKKQDGAAQFQELEVRTNRCLAYSSSGAFFGVNKDGTVSVAEAETDRYEEVSNWKNVIAIACNYYGVFGLTSEGNVLVFNEPGRYNPPTFDVSGWSQIKDIVCGTSHIVGLKNDGTLVAAGDNDKKQCDVNSWTAVKNIVAYGDYTVAVRESGTVYMTENAAPQELIKDNYSGFAGYSFSSARSWSDIKTVVPSAYFLLGIQNNGSVVLNGKLGWKDRRYVSYSKTDITVKDVTLSFSGSYVDITPNGYEEFYALRSDGYVDLYRMGESVNRKLDYASTYTKYEKHNGEKGWKDVVMVLYTGGKYGCVAVTVDGRVIASVNPGDKVSNTISRWKLW